LERISHLRHSIRTMLKIAKANEEDLNNDKDMN
jgi:hypothetical protein